MRFVLMAAMLFMSTMAIADIRCCVDTIRRDPDGRIARDEKVVDEFRKLHPCPSTQKTTGSCPGWAINHTYPLACKGKDIVENMVWMPVILKSGSGDLPVDRWERKVYCDRQTVTMPDHGTIIHTNKPQ